MDRQELASFLRSRRARVRPADVGLPDGTRCRTPGLRREEIARLAGMSVDYYIRLEQGRGPHPSRQILRALARALRLSGGERDHPGIAELSARSPLFARLWDEGEVGSRRSGRKRMTHPVAGELDLHIDVLHVPERDQRVVLHTVTPGTPSHEAMRLLRVAGTQDLSPR